MPTTPSSIHNHKPGYPPGKPKVIKPKRKPKLHQPSSANMRAAIPKPKFGDQLPLLLFGMPKPEHQLCACRNTTPPGVIAFQDKGDRALHPPPNWAGTQLLALNKR